MSDSLHPRTMTGSTSARRTRSTTGSTRRRVPGAAHAVPRLRVPRDRRLPGLVPALRRDVELGPRLHEHRGRRQHQRRADLRPAAVRDHLPHRLALRPLHAAARLDPLARELEQRYNDAHRQGRSSDEHREPSPPSCSSPWSPSPSASRSGPAGRPARPPTSTPADAPSRGFQNGLAIAGDYMSAASFLGISGAIALYGYDGFLYSIGFLVAWLVALLLVAELLRNSGRYTMADQLAYRMRQRPVRTAAATSTVVVSIFYLLAQMVGAGALVALLLGVDSRGDQASRSSVVGAADDLLRHRRRHEGHDVGPDRQGRPADGRHAADHRPGAGASSTSTSPSCSAPPPRTPARARRSCSPACSTAATLTYARSTSSALGLALVLGTAGLPHILIRFYTVPTAQDARNVGALGDRRSSAPST